MTKSSSKPELHMQPRLLTKQGAAFYCGVCVSIFEKACPVRPTLLLDRIPRYDRFALDRWLDSIDSNIEEEQASISEVWDVRNMHSHKGPKAI